MTRERLVLRVARRAARPSYAASKAIAIRAFARGVERSPGPPTVVFTMGKTASTAITRAVAAAGTGSVFQVFRLDPAGLAAAERRYRATLAGDRRALRRRGRGFPGASHLWQSQALLAHPPSQSHPWNVITVVREPVAQAVSAFFHTAGLRGLVEGRDLEQLREAFVDSGYRRAPLRWFDREFASALDIDVYEHAFDPAVGWATIDARAVRVLVLRQESLDVAPEALAAFFGMDRMPSISASNAAATRPYGSLYREFVRTSRLPDAMVKSAYSSQYARHFYAPDELARFHAAWTGRARDPAG